MMNHKQVLVEPVIRRGHIVMGHTISLHPLSLTLLPILDFSLSAPPFFSSPGLFRFLRAIQMSPHIYGVYFRSTIVSTTQSSYWLVYKIDYSANFPPVALHFIPL